MDSATPNPAATPAAAAALGEFELIDRYFRRPAAAGGALEVGIGDDCALLVPTPGLRLAVSSDMLVEGRHFLSTVAPERLGHKALAVNLSDLAACGARPRAFVLALALPRADAVWLEGFARGLFALADAHGIALAGGDTTMGPLNICITVLGEVAPGAALLRGAARPGDDLYVSGTVGDARLALEVFRGHASVDAPAFEALRARMEQPTPRVALGQALVGVATAAIDISDGLVGDLSHILRASGTGATLHADALPLSPPLRARPTAQRLDCALAGGDDYELLFCAPAARRDAVLTAARAAHTPVTRIGRIDAEAGLRLLDAEGRAITRRFASFDHFA